MAVNVPAVVEFSDIDKSYRRVRFSFDLSCAAFYKSMSLSVISF